MKRLAPLIVASLLSACSPASDEGPIAVNVIGQTAAGVDPSRRPLSAASATLMAAVAQGLVRFDAGGQIEPGLAIRWDVSDDGLYYTFRIDPALADAAQTARALRAVISSASRNPLKPVLGAIAEIVAVTPEVIEIRLTSPRPDLLPLLAQPQLAILVNGRGTGPLRIAHRRGETMLLTPAEADLPPEDLSRRQVRLHVETAARSVARFARGGAAAVTGGRFTDLFVARAAAPAADTLRYDPTPGMLGLVTAARGGFVGVADNRRALAMALDRQRIAASFGSGWRPATTLLPTGLIDRAQPTTPDWSDTPLDMRRILARETIASWLEVQGEPPVVRVALPGGPGGRLLFALIAADWRSIGVTAVAVRPGEPADLLLLDEVAPGDSAAWYLRHFECVRAIACSETADIALTRARDMVNVPERARLLGEADARLAEISAYIPIALPLRWSLVSRRLAAWTDNARGAHPLDQLRAR